MKFVPTGMLILAAAMVFAGCRESPEVPEARPTPVAVYEIQPRTIRAQIILSGVARPWQNSRLTAEISGQIVEVAERPDKRDGTRAIREGDRVERGELLFGIDTSTILAELRAAEANFAYTQETFERYRNLLEREAASEEEFQRWQSQAQQAQEAINAIRARLENARVTSPLNGLINNKSVNIGETVMAGADLCQVVQIDRLRVDIAVPENAVRFIEVGDELQLRFDSLPDEVVSGEVIFVAPMADIQTLTFECHVEVDNPDLRLRAGNIAKVNLVKRVNPEAVAVPLQALMSGVTGYRVMVVEDGKARSRDVELGAMDGDMFEILSGLELGDNLIVWGNREAVDGQEVDVRVSSTDLDRLREIVIRAASGGSLDDEADPQSDGDTDGAEGTNDADDATDDAESTGATGATDATGQGADESGGSDAGGAEGPGAGLGEGAGG